MKLIKNLSYWGVLATLILFFHLPLSGQNAFEGIIDLKTFNKEVNEKASIKWYVKEGNHKLQVSGSSEGYNYDYDILLKKGDPNLKMITEVNGKTTVYDVPPSGKEKENLGVLNFIREDESKTISGYKCHKIQIVSPNSASTCWVSDELSLSLKSFPGWLRSNPVYQVLIDNQVNGFPMQIETISSQGELLYSVKVEKVASSTVSSSEFELPASYIDGEKAIKESFEAK